MRRRQEEEIQFLVTRTVIEEDIKTSITGIRNLKRYLDSLEIEEVDVEWGDGLTISGSLSGPACCLLPLFSRLYYYD